MTRKWKYWVGHLILDKGGQGYPHPSANGPRIDSPVCKPGSTMGVSDRTHWGMLATDIKQVEWYVAQFKAWGVAVYCDPYDDYDDDVERLPVFREGEFIGWLYDPADADLAQSELDERDRRAAEWSKHCAVLHARGEEHAEIIKRLKAKGCIEINKKDHRGRSYADPRYVAIVRAWADGNDAEAAALIEKYEEQERSTT
jgi:hypothetical protein